MDASRGAVRQLLPAGLAEMVPGPELGLVLAGVDRSRVAADDLRDLVRARSRQVAFEQAELLADVLDAGRSALAEPDSLERASSWDAKHGSDVVSWMLGVSASWAHVQLQLAAGLIDRLPEVYAALRAGELDLAKAQAFVDALSGVTDDEVARGVAGRLLGRARKWTLTQLRERLRYHVDRADSAAARRRYQRGVAGRGVSMRPEEDGTAYLSAWGLPPQRAAAAFDRVDRLARAARAQGDARTLCQLRADACLDLLAGDPFQIAPTIDPLTAEADAAFPPDAEQLAVDAWEREREPVPPAWFHAPRLEEEPPWWRAARRSRPRPLLTPQECERRARAERSGADSRFRNGRPAGGRFVTGTSADLPEDHDPGQRDYGDAGRGEPQPAWWSNAPTTRPQTTGPGATAGEDSRFGNGNMPAVLAGDRCTCTRVMPVFGRGSVEIQMKLSTLAGLDDDPALIPGFGPVLADIARQVALEQRSPIWRYSIFGHDGALAHHGRTRRRPTAKDAAYVRARDRSCRTPTCTRTASRSELDHRIPWADGGPSLPFNLDCRCTKHHDLRELEGVIVQRHGATTTITLPCGNTYQVGPDKDLILVNE